MFRLDAGVFSVPFQRNVSFEISIRWIAYRIDLQRDGSFLVLQISGWTLGNFVKKESLFRHRLSYLWVLEIVCLLFPIFLM